MKKTKIFTLLFIVFSLSCFVFTGCTSDNGNSSTENDTFTIVWKNYDGTLLETDTEVAKGTTPTFDGVTPTKASDDINTYTFTGWSPAVELVSADMTYTAQFSSMINKYQVSITNDAEKGTVTGIGSYDYGSSVTIKATANDNYLFDGWYQGLSKISSNPEYSFVIDGANITFETKYVSRESYFNEVFTFEDSADGITITGVKDNTITELNVVNKVNDKNIIAISYGAFKDCDNLKSIILPFVGNTPSTFGYFGYIFGAGNYSYNEDYVPDTLNEVFITNATCINDNAFNGCESLTSVIIGETVESINRYAFSDCSGLTSITIGEKVESINSNAFSGCSSLTSIFIPASVTSIAKLVFSKCSSLTSIVVADDNTIYDSRDNCNAIIETSSNSLLYGCQKTIIPSTVTKICENSFSYCNNLVSISFGDSVEVIEAYAFKECSDLTSIVISKNVSSINEFAFYNCPQVTSIKVSSQNETFDSRNNCNAIIETSTNKLVYGCQNTVIPNNISTIGKYAFAFCKKLEDLVFSDELTTIEERAFYQCPNLVTVTMPNVTTLAKGAFYDCNKIETVTMGEGIETIESEAFFNCYSLKSITLPDSVTMIDSSAFASCSSLETISLSDNLENIGINAFSNSGLKEIVIPDSVTTISNNAFYNCTGISSVNIPASVTIIGSNVLCGCSSLSSLTVDQNNEVYNSVNGGNVIIETATKTLIVGSNNAIIPSDTLVIKSFTFYSLSDLTSITLPETLITIGSSAFKSSGITSINIPSSVVTIGQAVFQDCGSLESITVSPANSIYDSRSNCNAIIETATNKLLHSCKGTFIPDGVESLADFAFSKNCGLKSIIVPSSVTSLGQNVFSSSPNLESVTILANITKITSKTFFDCEALKSVTFSATITCIDAYAFEKCTNIESVVFKNTENWYVSDSSTGKDGIAITGLDDESNAAKLVEQYIEMYWIKK